MTFLWSFNFGIFTAITVPVTAEQEHDEQEEHWLLYNWLLLVTTTGYYYNYKNWLLQLVNSGRRGAV